MTTNDTESFNLAPFSYFAPLYSDPALLVVLYRKQDDTTSQRSKYTNTEKECGFAFPVGDLNTLQVKLTRAALI